MKFGVREICDVVLKAKSNVKIGSHTFAAGEPVIYFDTAKTSSLEGAATTVYAQGGKGNSRLIAWEGEKTLTFTMEDALISPKGLAILAGADLLVADSDHKVIAHTTEQLQMVSNNGTVSATLSKKPVTTADIYVMLLDNNGEMSGVPMKVGYDNAPAVSATGVVTGDILKAGDIILVDYYVEYTGDAQQINITPDQFAGFYYLEASTLFRREADGRDLPAEFIIPKVKIQSNFTFNLASTGDPSTFTFTMDAFPDYMKFDKTKKVLASIQILDADDNFDLTSAGANATPEYERYQYGTDESGEYIWDAKTDGTNPGAGQGPAPAPDDTLIYPDDGDDD